MTPDLTPDELRDLLGAYALDALEPDERAQVDALLLSDPSARTELHELQHAAAWLGHASLRPPASAWSTIAAEVDRDLATGTPPEPATPMPAPTKLEPRRTTQWLVAAVLVLAIGAAGVIAVVDRSSGPDSVTTKFEAALRDRSARRVTLHSTGGRYSARAVVLPNRTGYISKHSMPRVSSGRDLQLWSITPGGPVSIGLMRGTGDVAQFRVPAATTALAVTNEPRGGSPTPTRAPIVSGDLGRA